MEARVVLAALVLVSVTGEEQGVSQAKQWLTDTVGAKKPSIVGRIDLPEPHLFPFFVLVYTGDRFICGGSLVDRYVVLTAGHCVEQALNSGLTTSVRLGVFDRTIEELGVQKIEVARAEMKGPIQECDINTIQLSGNFVVHTDHAFGAYPFYKNHSIHYKNDVGLLYLKQPAELNDRVEVVQQLAVFGDNKRVKRNAECFVAGYGIVIVAGKPQYPPYPLHGIFYVQSPKRCLQKIQELEPDPSKLFFKAKQEVCVIDRRDGPTLCPGDMGGPLFCYETGDPTRYIQHGIASWGACGDEMSVFARVAKYRRWILNKVQAYRRDIDE